jgi:hypothetical protein
MRFRGNYIVDQRKRWGEACGGFYWYIYQWACMQTTVGLQELLDAMIHIDRIL